MIERLRIENFKVFRDVEFPLQPLTVIVGPNASGKSSILQALEWWADKVTDPRLERGPRRPPLTRMGAINPLCVKAFCAGTWISYQNVSAQMNPGYLEARYRELLADPNWVVLRCLRIAFEVGRLAAPFYSKQLRPRLMPNGDGLAGVVAHLRLEHLDQFQDVVQSLRSVVGTVEEVRVRSAHVDLREPAEGIVEGVREKVEVVRQYTGFELLFDMKGAPSIPAEHVSEGTLYCLGLLALLNAPDPPNLLLIDDIERGLHPRAMGELIGQLRRLQGERPDLQIVATSHSPLLVDFLKPEEVLLTALNPDGSASVAPLTDHPDFERWKDVMEPGEFWSTVGEKWITDRSPAEKP